MISSAPGPSPGDCHHDVLVDGRDQPSGVAGPPPGPAARAQTTGRPSVPESGPGHLFPAQAAARRTVLRAADPTLTRGQRIWAGVVREHVPPWSRASSRSRCLPASNPAIRTVLVTGRVSRHGSLDQAIPRIVVSPSMRSLAAVERPRMCGYADPVCAGDLTWCVRTFSATILTDSTGIFGASTEHVGRPARRGSPSAAGKSQRSLTRSALVGSGRVQRGAPRRGPHAGSPTYPARAAQRCRIRARALELLAGCERRRSEAVLAAPGDNTTFLRWWRTSTDLPSPHKGALAGDTKSRWPAKRDGRVGL